MDLKNIWQIFDNDHEIDCLFYGIQMTNSLVKNQSSDIFHAVIISMLIEKNISKFKLPKFVTVN